MLTETLAPIFGNNTTKALIIQTLTEKPLTIKEIHTRIQKTTNKNITYQAMHKATKEMITDQILEKHGKQVRINKEWVEKLAKLTEQLQNQKDYKTVSSTIQKFEYNTFSEFGKAILREWMKIQNPNNLTSFCILNHAWPLMSMDKEDWTLFQKLFTNEKFYGIISNSTQLDIAFEKPFETFGKRVIVDPTLNLEYDLIIIGDSITQVYFEKSFKQEHDKLFRKYKKLDEKAVRALTEHFLINKTRIVALLITDPQLAELNRRNALSIVEKSIKKHKTK